jgi:hypothetical protein
MLLTFSKAERFHKFSLTATAVNANVYTQQLHEVPSLFLLNDIHNLFYTGN